MGVRLLIALLCMCFLQAIDAQTSSNKKNLELQNEMWNTNDKNFLATEIPNEWKGESIVVLCRNIDYKVKKAAIGNLLEEIYYHERIKLLDKSSVEEYSQFNFGDFNLFGKGNIKLFAGIKVVKQNGAEEIVEFDRAVLNEIKVGRKKYKYKKIAIPNLEPGDILDYYFCIERVYINNKFLVFSPIYYPLTGDHNILKQKINVHVMRKCYLNAKSVNGAPKLKKSYLSSSRGMIYTLEDSKREKVDSIRWLHEYRELPTLKLQAYYSRNYEFQGIYSLFLGYEGELNNSFDSQGLVEFTEAIKMTPGGFNAFLVYIFTGKLSYDPDRSILSQLKSYMRKYSKSSHEIQAKEAFYYLRQYNNNNRYIKNLLYGDGNKSIQNNNVGLMRAYSRYLYERKIDHDFIYTIPREYSSLKDLILLDELIPGIKINLSDETIFVCDFLRHNHFREVGQETQDNWAYAVKISKKNKGADMFDSVKIPVDSASNNSSSFRMLVDFKDDFDKMSMDCSFQANGQERYKFDTIMVTDIDYMNADRDSIYKFRKKTYFTRKELKEYDHRLLAKTEEENNKRIKKIEEFFNEKYKFSNIEIDDLRLLQNGLWPEYPEIRFDIKLSSDNLLEKVGENYLLEVGRLFQSVDAIQDKEKKRVYNIYWPYAKEYIDTIIIQIPTGYMVKGMSKLNLDHCIEVCGFKSKALIEGNKLKFFVNEYYTNNFVKKEKWGKIVGFYNTKSRFSKQKILFEKISD